ncbi:DUF4377 domain-containing protein [Thermomonas sp. HDW16]|uniref:DUF4377 domain-containing protein n=1 Tax=Thermomonas sp. HDW16 TaxID=2714945 RepID=UPI00140D26C1|nr:DUF4377 domain-containing protein [Thermomonas sp. HDW16]QIL19397.1 META and DUF4377 domain-containing protein [Thermomonas sp. HDW16]
MNRLLLPLLAAALLAGCPNAETNKPIPAAATATPAPTASGLAAQLARYHWYLQGATDAKGKRIDALFAREDKPLQLDFTNGRIGIGNSCNHIGGSFSVTAEGIEIGSLMSTQMACANPKLMALDAEASRRLEGSLALLLAESEPPQLRISNRAGDTLSFRAEPTADTRFGGPGERVFLEVAAQTQRCHHPLIPDMQCLQVREIHYDAKGLKAGTPGPFQHFYDAIEGYTHEPGVRNVLRVNRYAIKNPPMDASNTAWVLDMVVESEASAK